MFRKTLIRLGLVLVLLLFVGAGVWYWLHIKTFVSTDDAYVYGYMGVISARVPGRVAKVTVDDNHFVKPGQVLLTLEPQDFEATVAQAEGNLGRLRQDLGQAYVKVATAQAKLTEAEANFKLANIDKARYNALYERRTVPKTDPGPGGDPLPGASGPGGPAKRELQEPWRPSAAPPRSPSMSSPPSSRLKPQLEQARLNLDYTR